MRERKTVDTQDVVRFERRLQALHAHLVREVEGLEQDAFATETGAPDRQADGGVDAYAQEVDLDLIECNEETLSEVVAALERLLDGSFGACAACARRIALQRLELLP